MNKVIQLEKEENYLDKKFFFNRKNQVILMKNIKRQTYFANANKSNTQRIRVFIFQ
jgi:hypothetical protein